MKLAATVVLVCFVAGCGSPDSASSVKKGACVTGDAQPAACGDARAAATVLGLTREVDNYGKQPVCPATTDAVLPAGSLGVAERVCVRNLKPPHPGDPGAGGGPNIDVGDCVTVTPGLLGHEPHEVACGQAAAGVRYRMFQVADTEAACPSPRTAVSFPTGPAERLRAACAERI